jgi:hydrogenase nickel incorporation protein HypB
VVDQDDALFRTVRGADRADYARRVNPDIEVLLVSARSGQGMDAWLDWLLQGDQPALSPEAAELARLRARVAELEAQLAAKG